MAEVLYEFRIALGTFRNASTLVAACCCQSWRIAILGQSFLMRGSTEDIMPVFFPQPKRCNA
jgi:hypothetical protein